MNLLLCALAISLVAIGSPNAQTPSKSPPKSPGPVDARLHGLMDRVWEFELDEFPTSLADFDNNISRLNDVHRFVDEQIELLKQGIQRGLVQPSIIIRDSVGQARAHVVSKGIQENARIRAEIETIREQLEFDGDLPAFLKYLRTDPKFYAKTPDELLQSAALILKRVDGRLPELFITDLRRQAEEALGERLDMRQFHDMLLRSGSIQLPVLQDQFQRYLAESKADVANAVSVDPLPPAAQSPAVEKSHRFDPVVRKIEGWTVHIDPALVGESTELPDAARNSDEDAKKASESDNRSLTMLANHLQRISILIPPETLRKLKRVEIWIEKDHPVLGAMQYHPSRGWLLANDHDERLTKKVHIPHADELLSKEQMLKHPAVILHELAHAYHDQFLSFDHPDVIAAFEKAKMSKSYEDVLLYTGRNVRHYGLSNHKEYFAEGTEAYFYRNDFYPFVRAELKQHDPGLHDLLKRLWSD